MTTLYMQKYAGRTALYRLYDAEERLLYVGITHDCEQRWREHSYTKPWWHLVERKVVEWLETRAEALAEEKKTVREEKPLHDGTHRVGHGWTRFPRPARDMSYVAVADKIRADVLGGVYPVGRLLPSRRDLSERYDTSMAVVGAALDVIHREGLLKATFNSRYRVVERSASA